MTKNELNHRYFEWMYQLVCDEKYTKGLSYRKLLNRLHEIDFYYILDMDGNRYEDGIDLRYRFGYEHSYEEPMIATYLDDRSCSVLEMLVALAIRCEEHIMDDPRVGNRMAKWFWDMISNLGLDSIDDLNFDEELVDEIIEHFLNRDYESNGKGGLFTVNHRRQDLRSVEIWYQMCWYLDSIL